MDYDIKKYNAIRYKMRSGYCYKIYPCSKCPHDKYCLNIFVMSNKYVHFMVKLYNIKYFVPPTKAFLSCDYS